MKNSIIEQGKIETLNKNKINYEMTLLNKDDLYKIIDLQKLIITHLKNPNIFQPDNDKFIEFTLETQGKILGIFSKKKLIAYLMIVFPGKNGVNLGNDVLISESELDKVAHLENVVVHPEFRGHSLQFKLQSQAIKIIKNLGYSHICSTVSPYNYPSLKNLLKSGLLIKNLKLKYNGKMRYICHKNIVKEFSIQNKHSINLINTEFTKQIDVLQQGYYGYQIEKKTDDIFTVKFGKSNKVVSNE